MTQPLADKIAAIISLLGWVYAHLEYMPCAQRAPRQQWVSERSSLDEPPRRPRITLPECQGQCSTCLAYQEATGVRVECPPDEKWMTEYRRIRSQYRITAVTKSLLRLAEVDTDQAQAVWAVYVEPWPGQLVDHTRPALGTKTEAISEATRLDRAYLAEAGVEWMAHEIRGEVHGPGEKGPTTQEQVASLVADGITSPSEIARRVGCSTRHAKRLKAAAKVRRESTPSAPG